MHHCICSSYSVQFQHKDIEVDLYVSYDWQEEGGFDALYDELLRQRTSENLSWFCPAAAERQKIFILEQPDQVRTLFVVRLFLFTDRTTIYVDMNRAFDFVLAVYLYFFNLATIYVVTNRAI